MSRQGGFKGLVGDHEQPMPKNKTHKGLLKRIRVTKTGLIKHKRCGGKHLRSDKPGSRIRFFRLGRYMTTGEAKRLELMLFRRLRGRNQPRAALRRSPSPDENKALKAEKKAASAALAAAPAKPLTRRQQYASDQKAARMAK